MGRPLLSNRHVKFSSGHDPSRTQLLPLVGDVSLAKLQAKLIFNADVLLLPDIRAIDEDELSLDAMDRYLAALSQRVPLLFIGLPGNVAIELFLQRQVSTHFRTIIDIEPSTSCVITSTPSEPLLSLAAADLFRKQLGDPTHGVRHRLRDSIRIIRHFRSFYGFTMGLDDEEMARLLLTMATDIASVNELNLAAERIALDRSKAVAEGVAGNMTEARLELWREGITLEPLTVWAWLVALLGDQIVRATAFSMPEGSSSAARSKGAKSDFERFARSATITFTHFAQLPNNIRTVSKRQLSEWFAEHVAIFGAAGQESWDLLIPVYLDEDWNGPSTIIDIAKFSFVVIQVKNRSTLVPLGQIGIDPPKVVAEPSDRSSHGAAGAKGKASEPLEYLSIFMQLKAVPRRGREAVSYSCHHRGKTRAHELQTIGIEDAFGELLRRLGDDGAIDDAYVLLGTNRSRLVFEDTHHREEDSDIDPRVAYGRAHKRPDEAPA
ncbi:uncharacterized protein PFL1_06697 [Pseudozyma flocculosa PF-1]|nr:uncharacterized protein PFL1_06697 [Pseudozyma flocculosa PF-1]EPQ25703.1 hypothetical protein PFL1_06697 [Pseudozyma flocculosa PF-1]